MILNFERVISSTVKSNNILIVKLNIIEIKFVCAHHRFIHKSYANIDAPSNCLHRVKIYRKLENVSADY